MRAVGPGSDDKSEYGDKCGVMLRETIFSARFDVSDVR